MLTIADRQSLIAAIVRQAGELEQLSDTDVMRLITAEVSRRTHGQRFSLKERKTLIEKLFQTMRGLDVLQPLVEDPDVTEIMVNGHDTVFIERDGKLAQTSIRFEDKEHLTQVITRFFGRSNRLINEQKPIADLRLDDGSRVHAVLPPAAPNGPILCIRRFTGMRPEMNALVRAGSLSDEAAIFLNGLVLEKKNLFISGGTGSGKTTMLNALSTYIPRQERVITIEDAMELQLPTIENIVRLEARIAGPDGHGQISLSDLIRSSLRLRPDRIIVGEVRGKEAYDMLQAMQTGHPGSMSTGHGNSAEAMLERLSLFLLTSSELPWEACRRLIAQSLDFLIHLERRSDGSRVVAEILQIQAYEDHQFILKTHFRRTSNGALHYVS